MNSHPPQPQPQPQPQPPSFLSLSSISLVVIGMEQTSGKTSLPWKTRVAFSVISTVADVTRRSNGTVNRRLLNLVDLKAPPNPIPIKGVKSSDVILDPSRDLWFRVFIPTDHTGELPVIVFFHGGGFVYLSPNNRWYDAVCRRFARKVPAIVVSVNYRLAPEHRYPAQYDDGLDVLKFLHKDNNRKKFLPENADLSRCFLAGDSAGANIAHHVAKRVFESPSMFTKIKVMGVVAIQPFFGGEERTESEKRLIGGYLVSLERTDWMWRAFVGEAGDRDHEAINVSGPRAAVLLEFPATMVVVGGLDALQDWQRRYYHWLKASGKEAYLVEYPNMIHVFYLFSELPESAHLISQVTDFIHTQASTKNSS